MLEAERVRLYNDLCDYEQELKGVLLPRKTREIDIIHRAATYVRGERSRWVVSGAGCLPVFDGDKICDFVNATCENCKFGGGRASFRFCPNCGAKMR